MTEQYAVRPLTEEEFARAYVVDQHAFHTTWPTEPEMRHFRQRLEFDRSLAAFDGPAIIAVAAVFSFRMSVPGAIMPTAGVTAVAVLPSYRRRGILRSLMTRQLADIHDRGEAIAALWASESGIYRRFGYGAASKLSSLRIRRGEGQLAHDAAPEGDLRLRIVEPQRARPELAMVYDAMLPGRPGALARDDRWWDAALYDPEYRRDGYGPLRCLLAEDSSGPRGYALYSGSPQWDEDGIPGGVISIRELIADGAAATAGLWGDLLSRDLTGEVLAWNRPLDDPLQHLLADPRRIRARTRDGLWIRLVDVPAALAKRGYAAPADVVIEVSDDTCPWNTARWRLRTAGAGEDRARCERTDEPADLALPVAALGAAYLGGTRLGELAGAGIVTELRPGALAQLSTAMSWDPAPWCPMIF